MSDSVVQYNKPAFWRKMRRSINLLVLIFSAPLVITAFSVTDVPEQLFFYNWIATLAFLGLNGYFHFFIVIVSYLAIVNFMLLLFEMVDRWINFRSNTKLQKYLGFLLKIIAVLPIVYTTLMLILYYTN